MRALFDPLTPSSSSSRRILDSNALVLLFPGPKSVTGEDVLEFHVHGGPAIVKAVLSAIGRCNTTSSPVRYAEPGEFTRRAFMNDRLDLPQIEALGDTLSAVTEEQRRISVQGTTSGLAARYEKWRKLLLYARGELEALIDFSEDQHFDESPSELASNVAVQIRTLVNKLSYHYKNAARGELLRTGINIALIGAPNVGKSSLLNLIVGRNAAIVSQEAGTTRDVVEVGLDLGGFYCRLGDTAGLRHSQRNEVSQALANVVGDIEKEGIRRAKERASNSDVVIAVLAIEPSFLGQGAGLTLAQEVLNTLYELLARGKRIIVVVNKMDNYGTIQDLLEEDVVRAVQIALPAIRAEHIFCLSCRQADSAATVAEDGLADVGNLRKFLVGLETTFKTMTKALAPDIDVGEADPAQWEESLGATQRQGALLEECQRHLQTFLDMVTPNPTEKQGATTTTAIPALSGKDDVDIVMAAESLRVAADCLGKITGRGEAGDVEDVLGVVFEK